MRNTNPKRTPRRQSAQRIYGLVAFAVVLLLGFLVYQWLKWDLYLIWLLVVTFVTFIFYRYDKIQAQKPGAMRVPEVILLALLAIGGVLGGAAGMLVRPRHKTQKPLFWIVLGISAAIHAYLIYQWLFV